jgi:hypothetical protein
VQKEPVVAGPKSHEIGWYSGVVADYDGQFERLE